MPDVASAELDAAQNAILSSTTTYYMGLNFTDPGETGANEVSGSPYARQAITFNASSGGTQTSSDAQSIPAPNPTTGSLGAAISSTTATSITLSAALGPSSGNFVILIDSEQMLVTAGNGTTTLTVTRGYNGTTAATHLDGATVTVGIIGFSVWTTSTAGTYYRGGLLNSAVFPPASSDVTVASGAISFTAS